MRDSYETSWAILHRLRRAVVRLDRERLKEKVEVDETYLGGPEVGLHGGRQLLDEALVVAAVEVRGKASGRVRLQMVRGASGPTLTGSFRFNRRRTPMAAFQTLLGLATLHGPTSYNLLYVSELTR